MATATATRRRTTATAVIAAAFTIPALAKGEAYAGVLLDDTGKPSHHLVLLPGETKDTWAKAKAWAKKQGGELPTRREQSLLFANAKQHFPDGGWHWSSEQYASVSSYAWIQAFSNGDQYDNHTSGQCRARAVRRVPIQ